MNAKTRHVVFSSGKDDWETPDDLFRALDEEFHFQVDVAANRANHKCAVWFGPGGIEWDALARHVSWAQYSPCWMNPPYSRGLQAKFIERAYLESLLGAFVVGLLPARTDTVAFHEWIYGKAELRFLRGRIKFVDPQGKKLHLGHSADSAPFPSMIVIWRPKGGWHAKRHH